MMGFKHNRKRNSALVYELLIRRMGSQLIAQDLQGCKITASILSRYFSSLTEVSKEKELSETVKVTRGVSRQVAEKVLREIYDRVGKIDQTKLLSQKNRLIRDINHAFGIKFFSEHRIPDYRILASIQMALDGSSMKLEKISENVQRIQLEEAIIKFMTSTSKERVDEHDTRIDGVVCSLANQKFQERYGDQLIPCQKRLLDRYFRSLLSKNDENLKKFLGEEIVRIRTELTTGGQVDEVKLDPITFEKYKEVKDLLEKIDITHPNSNLVKDVMFYQRLCEELKS